MMYIFAGVFVGSIKYLLVMMIFFTIIIMVKSIIASDEIKAKAMDIAARFISRKDPVLEIRIKKNKASKIVQDFEVLTQQNKYYKVKVLFNISRFMKIRRTTKFSHTDISNYDIVINNNASNGVYHINNINKEGKVV